MTQIRYFSCDTCHNLDYGSARELDKLPQNKQGEAYRMARKMAAHDRKPSPSSRLVAKAVKKIHICHETELARFLEGGKNHLQQQPIVRMVFGYEDR